MTRDKNRTPTSGRASTVAPPGALNDWGHRPVGCVPPRLSPPLHCPPPLLSPDRRCRQAASCSSRPRRPQSSLQLYTPIATRGVPSSTPASPTRRRLSHGVASCGQPLPRKGNRICSRLPSRRHRLIDQRRRGRPELRSEARGASDGHAGRRRRGRQPRRGGGGGHGHAAPEPLRVAETAGLEHVRAVPAQPPAAAGAGAVQRRARARVPALPRPVRQDQGARAGVPLLRPPVAAGAVPVPAAPGLGQPRRARRPPARRLRGARRAARCQPLRSARRAPLPPRGPRQPGQGTRHRLREEAPEEAVRLIVPVVAAGRDDPAAAGTSRLLAGLVAVGCGDREGRRAGARAGRRAPTHAPAPALPPPLLHAAPAPAVPARLQPAAGQPRSGGWPWQWQWQQQQR